jgi:hypothetical protein
LTRRQAFEKKQYDGAHLGFLHLPSSLWASGEEEAALALDKVTAGKRTWPVKQFIATLCVSVRSNGSMKL